MKNIDYKLKLVIAFVIVYALFVTQVDATFDHYGEIVGATVFFFALFAGFFISRQNDRYDHVVEEISESDGLFSYLYRASGIIPGIQDEVREIIRSHYQKISDSNNWAYHLFNPSTTITDLTNTFAKVNEPKYKDAAESPAFSSASEIIWDVLLQLQLKRKRLIILSQEKLLFFQWFIIYLLAVLLVVTLNFIPSPVDAFYVDILKVIFGTAVFMVIILLKQLNDLSLFGRDFARKTAKDVFRILDEKDAEEIKSKK